MPDIENVKIGLKCCSTSENECKQCPYRFDGIKCKSMNDLIKRKDAERTQEGCEWCKPDDNGDYTMSAFVNPNNPSQEAMLFVYGGEIVIEINMDNNSQKARMATGINYCPMCGRKFAKEDIDGD